VTFPRADAWVVLMEVDILGNLVRSWYSASHPAECDVPEGSVPVAIDSVHHEMTMLPDGNFLVLSTEGRWVDGFPTSEDDPNAPKERAYVWAECSWSLPPRAKS
jgi:arylsulfate sulfotransferase